MDTGEKKVSTGILIKVMDTEKKNHSTFYKYFVLISKKLSPLLFLFPLSHPELFKLLFNKLGYSFIYKYIRLDFNINLYH